MPRTNRPHDVFKHIDMTSGEDACWPWKRSLKGGKGRPYFDCNGKKHLAYRLVYELVNGVTLTEDQFVRHTCDNGADGIGCCNPKHMILGDNAENMNDMKTRERHGLPHNTVRAIKRLLANGEYTHKEIGDRFGISREQVTHINNERAYAHVSIDGDDEEPTSGGTVDTP